MRNKKDAPLFLILGVMGFLGILLASGFLFGDQVQETFLGISRDTLYFGDANPYPENLEITDIPATPFKKLELNLYSPISSRLVYSAASLCTGDSGCLGYPCSSQSVRGRCCQANGYQDVSTTTGACFKWVSVNPSVTLYDTDGKTVIWKYDGTNTAFPQMVDISSLTNLACAGARQVSSSQNGNCITNPCDCNVRLSFQSSESAGSMQVGLGAWEVEPAPPAPIEQPAQPVEGGQEVIQGPIEEPNPTITLTPPAEIEKITEDRQLQEKLEEQKGFNYWWLVLGVSFALLLVAIFAGMLTGGRK